MTGRMASAGRSMGSSQANRVMTGGAVMGGVAGAGAAYGASRRRGSQNYPMY